MSESCRNLVAFVDGELEEREAAEFRSHLETCDACGAELVEAMQLRVRLDALGASQRWKPLAEPTKPTEAKSHAPAWVAVAAAAAFALWLLWPRPPAIDAFAKLETRPEDVRFAYGSAATYRPHRTVRGTGSTAGSQISQAILGDLEKHDSHALALAMVWNGGKAANALELLHGLEKTPGVRSDTAAIRSVAATADNAEPVLAELESLRDSADIAAARAARWNYALLLERLSLPLSTAKAFTAIAGEQEPGWGREAADRAADQTKTGEDARNNWERADAAGRALRKTGAPVPAELIKAVPGILRVHFYNAVRTATTPERVQALAPLAAALDQVGDQRTLSDYVQRVAKLDFRRREPLALAYGQLLDHQLLPKALRDALDAPTDDVLDIIMGAFVELNIVVDNLDDFEKMTKRAGDPWFEILLAQDAATADERRRDWQSAETHLKRAQKLCAAASEYPCLSLAYRLGTLYEDLHRVPEAIEVLSTGVRNARRAGEWLKVRQLLWRLADVERFHASTATARAYANEVLMMSIDDCEYRSAAFRTLTGAAILDGDGRAARHHFEEALPCGATDLTPANYLADIGRLDPQPGDLARLQGWLADQRATGKLTAAQLALADEIEGRLLIKYDPAAGAATLQRAITAAERLPKDVVAQKARDGAYAILILDAAGHDDPSGALRLIAQDLGVTPPPECTVGISAEGPRTDVVVRGLDGKDHAASPRIGEALVSDQAAHHLAGCARVQVMARAALQGTPHVLPASLAWSYLTGARRGTAQGHESAAAQGLIVANVTPPPDLGLPSLSAKAPESTRSTLVLSGPAAKPSQVLAMMHDAGEIQFHTHALVDLGISDASHLVLSPEPDGHYALTAEAIRGVELRGRPIIVLAACRSAQGARYEHASWSLPQAFLAAGAQAVFAAGADIPDNDAGPFFSRVLARVRAGAAPAVALREERVAALASNPSSWVADVMLFE